MRLKSSSKSKRDKFPCLFYKYIIIPNVNDNRKEIDMWIDSVVKIGGKWLALDIEDIWYKNNRSTISSYYLDLVNYVINRANELGMKIELYDRARGLKEGKNIL